MTKRRLSRSVVLQTLFELDSKDIWDKKHAEVSYHRIAKEFNSKENDHTYALFLLQGIIDKKKQIDEVISKSVINWDIDKITSIDRNVLRIGIFELIFGKSMDVPERVALNEAIDLARTFGNNSSGKFTNGVLGFIYRELGEPGKESKTKNDEDVNKTKSIVGAIVYAVKDNVIYFAFVHDVFNHWSISKGSIKDGAEELSALKEIIKGEIDLDIKIEYKIGSNSYISNNPKEGKVRKEANYYLSSAEYKPLKLKDGGGLDDARWFTFEELKELSFYSDMRRMILTTTEGVVARFALKDKNYEETK